MILNDKSYEQLPYDNPSIRLASAKFCLKNSSDSWVPTREIDIDALFKRLISNEISRFPELLLHKFWHSSIMRIPTWFISKFET